MSISISSLIQSSMYTNSLTSSLEAAGLSSDAIDLVEEQLKEVVDETAQQDSSQQSSGSTDSSTIRAALDAKIADDVKSGKLSEEDATAIGKALDALEGQSTTDATSSSTTACAAASGGGGGSGGGSTEKTEVSRTETVSGNLKTTTITYDDGSTEQETSVVSDAEAAEIAAKTGGAQTTSNTDSAADAGGTGDDGDGDTDTDANAVDGQQKGAPGSLPPPPDGHGPKGPAGPDGVSGAHGQDNQDKTSEDSQTGSDAQSLTASGSASGDNTLRDYFAGFSPGSLFVTYR